MGMATNIIFIMLGIAFVSWLYGWAACGDPFNNNTFAPAIFQFASPATMGVNPTLVNSTINYTVADGVISFLQNNFYLVLFAAIGGVMALTTLGFPNPYLIFAPILFALYQLFVVPRFVFDLFNQGSTVINPLSVMFIVFFELAFFIALFSWWKGGDTP